MLTSSDECFFSDFILVTMLFVVLLLSSYYSFLFFCAFVFCVSLDVNGIIFNTNNRQLELYSKFHMNFNMTSNHQPEFAIIIIFPPVFPIIPLPLAKANSRLFLFNVFFFFVNSEHTCPITM